MPTPLRRADAVERDALLLEQAIQDAPGEGAMRASALEREVEQFEVERAAGPADPGRAGSLSPLPA